MPNRSSEIKDNRLALVNSIIKKRVDDHEESALRKRAITERIAATLRDRSNEEEGK